MLDLEDHVAFTTQLFIIYDYMSFPKKNLAQMIKYALWNDTIQQQFFSTEIIKSC